MTEDPDLAIDDMDPAELLEQASASLEAGEKDEAAKIFNAAGNIYMSVAEFEEAHKCFEESQRIYKELKDKNGTCDTMYNLGVASINLERWDEALTSLETAMKLFEKASNQSGVADAIYGLALASLGHGNFDEAMEYFKKAQKAYKTLENDQGMASVIMDMGAAYADKEDWTDAQATIKKALKLYEDMGDKSGIADALSLLGDIAETSEQNIDKELDAATKLYLSSPEGLRLDKENNVLFVSMIFKWYKNDFEKSGMTVTQFIYNFASEPIRKYIDEKRDNLKLKYIDYDWGLNVSDQEEQ